MFIDALISALKYSQFKFGIWRIMKFSERCQVFDNELNYAVRCYESSTLFDAVVFIKLQNVIQTRSSYCK
jgi:hypothetical protein